MTDPAVVPEPDQTDDALLDVYYDAYFPSCTQAAGLRAVYIAGRDSRDGILVPVEVLSRLTEFTHDHADCSENVAAFHTYDIARRLLAGHTTTNNESKEN